MSKAAIYDEVRGGNAFSNPAAGSIAATETGAGSALSKVQDDIADVDAALLLDPGNPELLQQKEDLENLETRLTVTTTGTDDPSLPEYYRIGSAGFSFALMLQHTNFFSGASSTPPVGIPTTGLSPINVMGAANGIKQLSIDLGRSDPNDPCAAVNSLFGSILGGLADLLGPLLDILTRFINGLVSVYDMINHLDNLIQNMWQLINDEIFALQQYLADLAAWALSNFIHAMIKDPCLAAVISSIASPTLKDAIQDVDLT